MSTMAKVSSFVAKSLFKGLKNLSQSHENPPLNGLQLPQHFFLRASKGAEITHPKLAGFELVIRKEMDCFTDLCY